MDDIRRMETKADDQAARDADAGEQQSLAHEHCGERWPLRAERHANADLARALRDGVRDDAVDADDSEQQGHASGDAEHHQREGGARHGFGVELAEGGDIGQGHIGIDGPDRSLHLVHEDLRAGARAADVRKRRRAARLFLAFEAVLHQRPVDGAGRRLAHAVVVHIA